MLDSEKKAGSCLYRIVCMEGKKVNGTGALAKSLAGHDKGDFFVIMEETDEYVLLVDGKLRPFKKPKT